MEARMGEREGKAKAENENEKRRRKGEEGRRLGGEVHILDTCVNVMFVGVCSSRALV